MKITKVTSTKPDGTEEELSFCTECLMSIGQEYNPCSEHGDDSEENEDYE